MKKFHLIDYRDIGEKQFYISTTYIHWKKYYETMIFPTKDEKVTDWSELFCDRYNSQHAAEIAHDVTCKLSDEDFLKLLK